MIGFSSGEGPWAKEPHERFREVQTSTCGAPYLVGHATHPRDLLEKSIHKCLDMYTTFTTNLEGTYKRPHTSGDLQRCQQQKDKSSRDFMSKWLEMKKSCEGIKDET
jgi:hypothetical protein